MPLLPGKSRSTISANISELTHHGSRPRSHAQIVAIALSNADKHPKAAAGGGIGAYSHGGPVIDKGFLKSDVPGRTDNLAITVPHGAHVIPADVVSVLGQGNSLAGAKHLREALDGLPIPGRKTGGGISDTHTPILAAGGEFIVSPDEVNAWGENNQKRGHDRIDQMIVRVRKAGAHKMLKLKGPKK